MTTGLTISLLLLAPAALADSQAAFGYNRLGQTPSHIDGSGQGGYLGQNAGPVQRPQMSAVPGERRAPTTDATDWCVNSPEPSRCRGRASVEDQICAGRSPESYGRCRAAMDQMHGP
ncbi:MAG: hypothetical protein JO021_12810 [Alphaproteobacteria bacterium]|nr:hypothetical protein [Alphaproteobacteria bacterium]